MQKLSIPYICALLLIVSVSLSVILFSQPASAEDKQVSCSYLTAKGVITLVNSRDEIPEEYLQAAKCKESIVRSSNESSQVTEEQPSSQKNICFYLTQAGKRKMVGSINDVPPGRRGSAKCFAVPVKAVSTQVQTKPKKINDERCGYQSSYGKVTMVESIDKVPAKYRKTAKCGAAIFGGVVAPDKVEIDGNSRRQEIGTPLGRGELRWARAVERDFGRTPVRAVIEATRAVKRTIRKPGFPPSFSDLDLPLKIVFLDEKLPETQIPSNLISNCHPGWMTPRANIYIVGQRIAAGCSGGPSLSESMADARMAEVLVHELGHAIEFELLGKRQSYSDRRRSEGFATWFERYVAQYSSLISRSRLERRDRKLAQKSFKKNPNVFIFRGTGEDYARASFFFEAIVKKKGVRGLVRVYDRLATEGGSFFAQVEKELNLSEKKLEEEVKKLVYKN